MEAMMVSQAMMMIHDIFHPSRWCLISPPEKDHPKYERWIQVFRITNAMTAIIISTGIMRDGKKIETISAMRQPMHTVMSCRYDMIMMNIRLQSSVGISVSDPGRRPHRSE